MWRKKPIVFSTRKDSRPGASGVQRQIDDDGDDCQCTRVHSFRKDDTHIDVVWHWGAFVK